MLTAVVAGAVVEEAVALMREDQDRGHPYVIVEIPDLLRGEEEIRRPEDRRPGVIEMCMCLWEEEREVGGLVIETDHSRGRRQAETIVDTAGV